jgi:hypothetical protein
MGNGCDPDVVALNSIDDPIIANDEFPYVRILILRHDSSELGERFQSIDGEDDTFGKVDGVGGGIVGDVVDNLVEIPARSYRPADFRHFVILRLTCS